MPSQLKRVLLLYTDKYYLIKQVYPFGLDLIANHLRDHGFEVAIEYPFLPSADPATNLMEILERSDPDLIGLGIRNLDTTMSWEPYGDHHGPGCQTFFFLPQIKEMVDVVRTLRPGIPIIAGGGGFTISPQAILQTLGIEYGIVGQGEEPLRQFLDCYPDFGKISKIPNLVLQDGTQFIGNSRRIYTFEETSCIREREKKFNYAYETVGLPVQVKRGCNQNCSYCVEPLIEGRKFVLREPNDIITELRTIAEKHPAIQTIFFVDTEFNLPDLDHCSALLDEIIASGLDEQFRFGSQFLPKPFDRALAQRLARAGFSMVLTCDSFTDDILETNGASYRVKDIITVLELCEDNHIDCTPTLVFGLPGETYPTIDRTLSMMMKYPPGPFRRYEYTVGARIYQGTPLCRSIESKETSSHLYGERSVGYLEPYYYCSPESPKQLKDYIERVLPLPTIYDNKYGATNLQSLSLSYLLDQGRWDEVAARFVESALAARVSIYDYLFRKLVDSGRTETARQLSENLLRDISEEASNYSEHVGVIRYYLDLLAGSDDSDFMETSRG
jgi:radical SAM superfamily enzyme YgiQ (UPF0313 family)